MHNSEKNPLKTPLPPQGTGRLNFRGAVCRSGRIVLYWMGKEGSL